MTTTEALIKRIEVIENRNKKVEIDKAWEGSYTRRALIVLFTYASIGIYMWAIGVENPLINAVIPALGFSLSTLSLPFFKTWWIKLNK
ncbi:hypothetical protein COV58_02605 [Candidatus Roizmanbacteria bacterium CG11_big_fil_rev_8_21_14_0_20_36_8]|uniref:Uncharacterized protein n=2 Tax=Candidatus Roizmaniibacteriota TaxID=1752723 RepID=A0A2M6IU23_9BACT|nr:MAG: hypothetical protein COV58_02605 [Candidatus Roizmanbacteria bacterium CG11_big_fil_rev_8_21_14_0_20_36_8]PIZ64508.1 MAG: hypothetical protein COY14_04575 [Candidatus Roizmanbacteria bacterium CG_4_10_14_0_2_um_filter_36_9]